MDRKELEARTRKFAVNVIRFAGGFSSSSASRVVSNQLLKSGTSIGANYREANRGVSRRDFAHRIGIAEKEASETCYWLEICSEAGLGAKETCHALLEEANELLAIFTSVGRSIRTKDHSDKQGSVVTERGSRAYAADDLGDEESDFVVPEVLTLDE